MTNLTNEIEAHEAQAERDGLMHAAILYLTTRFYPALPAEYAPSMLEAIDHCNAGDFDAEIELPVGIEPTPREAYTNSGGATIVTAGTLVRILRVEHMIEEDI